MYGYIYKSYCIPEGKYYIGSKKSDKFIINYFGSGNLIKEKIKEYTLNDFMVELIEECNSKEELEEKEKYWISFYNAINSNKFYNIKYTSNRTDNIKASNYQKIKQSKAREGKRLNKDTKLKISTTLKFLHNNGVKFHHREYKKHNISDEGRNIMSNTTKRLWEEGILKGGKDHPFYGKHHSDETKLKISKSRIGIKPGKETRELYSKQRKGKIYVNNGTIDKIIWPEQLNDFEKLGFIKGRLSSPIKGKKKNNEGRFI